MAPKRVALPDGSIGEFPDTMSDADIEGVLRKQYPPPSPKSTNWLSIQDTLDKKIGEFSRARTPEEIRAQTSTAPFHSHVTDEIEQSFQNYGRELTGGAAHIATHPLDFFKGIYDTGKEVVTHPPPVFAGNPLTSAGRADTEAAMKKWRAENNGPISDQVHAFQAEYAKNPRQALEHLSADLTLMYLSGKLLDASGKPIKAIISPAFKGLPEVLRKGAQTAVGAGERNVGRAVTAEAEAANTAAENTTDANKTADEKTLSERGAVDDANAKQAANDKAARLKVMRENKDTAAAHAAGKEDTAAANREAVRQQEKITPTKEKLESASAEMRAREEAAREKALQVGNEKFNTVNEELNPLPADMEKVQNLYGEAHSVLGETQSEPPILKRLGQSIEKGEALSYKDLQAAYSELGKELSKGTLDGRVYHAYDVLHDGIGEDMQRIANSKGDPVSPEGIPKKVADGKPTEEPAYTTAMGKQLYEAQAYWRRMKQTFGKPLSMTDNATAAVRTANPEFLSGDTQANRLRLLGSFDPEIPKVAQHIDNLRQGLAKLEEPKPLRKVVTVPPAAPEPTKLPKPTPPEQYAEPNPTHPIEVPELSTRAMRDKFVTDKLATWTNVTRFQASRLVASPIFTLIAAVTGHGGMSFVGAAYTLGEATPFMLQRMVENPSVREWFTRPPAGELETLRKVPHADRVKITDGLKQVVAEAQKNGKPISVSPDVARFLGMGTAAVTNSRPQHPTFSKQSPVR